MNNDVKTYDKPICGDRLKTAIPHYLILAAAGSSRRFGSDKLLQNFNGLPVLLHAIRNFYDLITPGGFVVAAAPGHLKTYRDLVRRRLPQCRNIIWTPGGGTRTQSIRLALDKLPAGNALVAIHDAARPLARPRLLEQLFRQAWLHGGAVPGKPVADSLKRVDASGLVTEPVDRDRVWRVETPQVFDLARLRHAYAGSAEATDDAEIMRLAGYEVVMIYNPDPNFKLTVEADLAELRRFAPRGRGIRPRPRRLRPGLKVEIHSL